MAQPLCPYFARPEERPFGRGTCGGCATQHLGYSLQLENKKKLLRHATGVSEVQVFSGQEYFYRNRLDLVFHPQGLGLRKKGDWRVIVPLQKCMISNERLNVLLNEILIFFQPPIDAFEVRKKIGTFRYAVIRTPANDSSIAFVLNKDSSRVGEAIEKIESFAEKTTAQNVLVVYVGAHSGADSSDEYFVVKGGAWLRGEYLGKKFWFAAQGFFQTNDVMAEKMHQVVHNLLSRYGTREAHLLDLYGGVGTFGIINAPLFKTVTVVESVPACIEAAKRNASENGIANLEAVVLDAKRLKKLPFPKPLFVISDPPRSGMHPKTIEQLNLLKPEVLIYVSCNVQQLGKDLPKFKDHSIKSVALFDLFPQTNHMEAVVELTPMCFRSQPRMKLRD